MKDGKKVALVIGGSRGIGRQVAIDLSKSDYFVAVAAKTTSDAYKDPFPPDPSSSRSTINTVVREIKEAGGDALALPVDVREFSSMAITSIWPASSIESAATGNHFTSSTQRDLRKPAILSDALLAMLKAPAEEVNGLIDTDEDFLRKWGVQDFSQYSVVPGTTPRRVMPADFPKLEVLEQDDEGQRMDSTKIVSRVRKAMDPASGALGVASATVTLAALALKIGQILTSVAASYNRGAALIYSLIGACQAIEVAWSCINAWIRCQTATMYAGDSSFYDQLAAAIEVGKVVLGALQKDLEKDATIKPGQKPISTMCKVLLNEDVL